MVRNLGEFEIYWDICTVQKDYAYIDDVRTNTCVDEYVRATV